MYTNVGISCQHWVCWVNELSHDGESLLVPAATEAAAKANILTDLGAPHQIHQICAKGECCLKKQKWNWDSEWVLLPIPTARYNEIRLLRYGSDLPLQEFRLGEEVGGVSISRFHCISPLVDFAFRAWGAFYGHLIYNPRCLPCIMYRRAICHTL